MRRNYRTSRTVTEITTVDHEVVLIGTTITINRQRREIALVAGVVVFVIEGQTMVARDRVVLGRDVSVVVITILMVETTTEGE